MKKRILIVDNEEAMTTLVSTVLLGIATHFEVDVQNEWAEAVQQIEDSEPYDLIITDFRMPRGREGLIVANSARERSFNTRVIVTSSDMTPTDLKETPHDGYLQKPFGIAELADMVRNLTR